MKIKIEKLVYGGSGVGELGGKKIFVPFSAPGDLLEVEISSDHKSYAEARISKILESSACRTEPKCPVFGSCGGCQWQHLSYPSQLEWKRLILIETLERIGKLNILTAENNNSFSANSAFSAVKKELVLPTLPSPKEWHYRNRIQLHVDSNGRAGFYRPKSKDVVAFEKCYIADERLNERLKIRHTTAEDAKIAEESPNPPTPPFNKGGLGGFLSANSAVKKELQQVYHKGFSLRLEEGPSFSQINTEQNERLKKLIVEWLSRIPHDNIVEFYAGGGNFTFKLASIAKRVFASDIDGRAVRYANERIKMENIKNIEFVCAPAHKAVAKFNGECDVILIDPPRKGCAEAIDAILSLKPQLILYISCDPATLARDIKRFNESGYRLERCQPVDMFPQTYHIESMNLLMMDH